MNKVEEPFAKYLLSGQVDGKYTYADYLSWEMEEMVELIKGKVFRTAAAAPRRIHQEISGRIFNKFFNFLEGKNCKVYASPFDVRLPVKSKKNEEIDTVVQPDISVICDSEKLDEMGCLGPPDLIVEVLSPGNNRVELQNKYEVYEASGVKEYWIIHPEACTLLVYTLRGGVYVPSRLFTSGDMVQSEAVPGFVLNLEDVFVGI